MQEGRLSGPRAAVEKLVNKDPQHWRFHYLLSRVPLKLQCPQEAESEFEFSKKEGKGGYDVPVQFQREKHLDNGGPVL